MENRRIRKKQKREEVQGAFNKTKCTVKYSEMLEGVGTADTGIYICIREE